MLLARVEGDDWLALVHPGQKVKPGTRMVFEDETRAPGVRVVADVREQQFFGRRLVSLTATGASGVDQAVDALGHVPLPPYIHRDDRPDDRERYQTVYARERGSVAAPTAGLHFSAALVDRIRGAGIGWETVTLHVGYGTFKPVRADFVEEHRVDAERYTVPPRVARAIAETRANGRRVIAVGTTTTRALESAASAGTVQAGTGETDLFIAPGHTFHGMDGLLTNFHLPKSSLLMLVAAFAGRDLTLAAYRDAVAKGFHFYSYGDAMLVI
jgi:S-adenosylmethionine:tRNA ribosyltransferase-isomerase